MKVLWSFAWALFLTLGCARFLGLDPGLWFVVALVYLMARAVRSAWLDFFAACRSES